MKCWICNRAANTGEHFLKHSDLKQQFGKVTQDRPIYRSIDGRTGLKTQSTNSIYLKSPSLICNFCNNTRTQPHDQAWEKLSSYLHKNAESIREAQSIELRSVFGNKVGISMLHVHLYFLKLFGDRIVTENVPLKISQFSRSIMKNKAHKNIYISLNYLQSKHNKKYVGRDKINIISIGAYASCVTWHYVVGAMAINIYHWETDVWGELEDHAWHPRNVGKTLVVKLTADKYREKAT